MKVLYGFESYGICYAYDCNLGTLLKRRDQSVVIVIDSIVVIFVVLFIVIVAVVAIMTIIRIVTVIAIVDICLGTVWQSCDNAI